MSNNFRKYPKTKQEEFKDFQVLLYKFKDIQGLEFSNFVRTLNNAELGGKQFCKQKII
jgi:hypothetical protein